MKRKRKKKRHPVFEVLEVIGFIMLLPVLDLTSWPAEKRKQNRRRSAAIGFRCMRCDAYLGEETLRQADADYNSRPSCGCRGPLAPRSRVVRIIDMVCYVCGQGYHYRDHERRFVEARMPA